LTAKARRRAGAAEAWKGGVCETDKSPTGMELGHVDEMNNGAFSPLRAISMHRGPLFRYAQVLIGVSEVLSVLSLSDSGDDSLLSHLIK